MPVRLGGDVACVRGEGDRHMALRCLAAGLLGRDGSSASSGAPHGICQRRLAAKAPMDGVVWELNPDQAPPKRCLLKSGVVKHTRHSVCRSMAFSSDGPACQALQQGRLALLGACQCCYSTSQLCSRGVPSECRTGSWVMACRPQQQTCCSCTRKGWTRSLSGLCFHPQAGRLAKAAKSGGSAAMSRGLCWPLPASPAAPSQGRRWPQG